MAGLINLTLRLTPCALRASTADCIEKKDLAERLRMSAREGKVASAMPTMLSESENRVVSIFTRVSPSVCFVQVSQQVQAPFQLPALDVPSGSGSGFLWDTDGHCVTNYHVIASRGPVPSMVKLRLQGSAESFDAEVGELRGEDTPC
jgi:S1-C subfamily serine protease